MCLVSDGNGGSSDDNLVVVVMMVDDNQTYLHGVPLMNNDSLHSSGPQGFFVWFRDIPRSSLLLRLSFQGLCNRIRLVCAMLHRYKYIL
jgi:hypothetical protein